MEAASRDPINHVNLLCIKHLERIHRINESPKQILIDPDLL